MADSVIYGKQFDDLLKKLEDLRKQKEAILHKSSNMLENKALNVNLEALLKQQDQSGVAQLVSSFFVKDKNVYNQNMLIEQVEKNKELLLAIRDCEIQLRQLYAQIKSQTRLYSIVSRDLIHPGGKNLDDVSLSNIDELKKQLDQDMEVLEYMSEEHPDLTLFRDPYITSENLNFKLLTDAIEQEVINAKVYQSDIDDINCKLSQKGGFTHFNLSYHNDPHVMRYVHRGPEYTGQESMRPEDFLVFASEKGLSDDSHNFTINGVQLYQALMITKHFIIPETELKIQELEYDLMLYETAVKKGTDESLKKEIDDVLDTHILSYYGDRTCETATCATDEIAKEKKFLHEAKRILSQKNLEARHLINMVESIFDQGVPLADQSGKLVKNGRFRVKEKSETEIEIVSEVDNSRKFKGKHADLSMGKNVVKSRNSIVLDKSGINMSYQELKKSIDKLNFESQVSMQLGLNGGPSVGINIALNCIASCVALQRTVNKYGQTKNLSIKFESDVAKAKAGIFIEKDGKKTNVIEGNAAFGHAGAKINTDVLKNSKLVSEELAGFKADVKIGGKNVTIFSSERTDYGAKASLDFNGVTSSTDNHEVKSGLISFKGPGTLSGEKVTLVQEKNGEVDYLKTSGRITDTVKQAGGLFSSLNMSTVCEEEVSDEDKQWKDIYDDCKTWTEIDAAENERTASSPVQTIDLDDELSDPSHDN